MVLLLVRVVAIVLAGMLAGIYFGHRAGPQGALGQIDGSSFVKFQQEVHRKYVRFMPVLVVAELLFTLIWLVLLHAEYRSQEFWLVAGAVCGNALIAAMTRAVSVPLNNKLMTWDAAAPPENVREVWTLWERVNTIRAVVAIAVLVCEAVAVSIRASAG
jgi:uncharacterized membrane protein